MWKQLDSEIRKVVSTRTWWLIGAAMVLATSALVAVLALAGLNVESSPLDLSTAGGIHALYSISAGMTYVFTVVAGVLIVTSEYSTGTIAQTLLATPRRSVVFVSKVVVAAGSGVVFGVVTTAATVGVSAALVSTEGLSTHLGNSSVLMGLAGTVATLTIWSVIGAGLGALVRNQLVAVVSVVVLTQAVEPMVRMVLPAGAGDYLPGSLADAASGGTVLSLAMGPSELSQGMALASLCAIAALIAALGARRFQTYQIR